MPQSERSRIRSGTAWTVALLLHVAAFAGALALRIDFKPAPPRYAQIAPEPALPVYAENHTGRGEVRRPGRGRTPGRGPAVVAQPVESLPPVTHPPAVTAERARSGFIAPPSPGDGRLWVSPRPALPGDIADALYGQHPARDSMIVRRLRAMVDSLNVVIDSEQRVGRLPSWVARGENGKPIWGLDPEGLYVAGIKIPTAALALLGNMLPAGNYDEAVRQRHLAEMRADLLQAAARTETLEQFRRYVRELRARKQAERDAARRARGDTASVQP